MRKHCCSCGKEFPETENFCNRDGSRLVVRDGLTGGVVAGRYRIEGLLGSGGYGDVYAAKVLDPAPGSGLGRGAIVGIKLIARRGRSTADWKKVRDLQSRESAVAGRIRHPNLLPIYDSGEDAAMESVFMAMPLGGRDLKTVIGDEGPLSPDYDARHWRERAAAIALQVCDALATLHSHEVYHTDVKPQNVMEFSGQMVLIDYGTAKGRGVTSQSSGVIRGTVDYMPPEYFRDAAWEYALVDQYSYGVLLHELFTGVLPFRLRDGLPEGAYQQAMILKHRDEPAPGVRSRQPDLPAELEAAILRMLEKAPSKRYPRMAEAGAALTAAWPAPGVPREVKGEPADLVPARVAAGERPAEEHGGKPAPQPPGSAGPKALYLGSWRDLVAGMIGGLAAGVCFGAMNALNAPESIGVWWLLPSVVLLAGGLSWTAPTWKEALWSLGIGVAPSFFLSLTGDRLSDTGVGLSVLALILPLMIRGCFAGRTKVRGLGHGLLAGLFSIILGPLFIVPAGMLVYGMIEGIEPTMSEQMKGAVFFGLVGFGFGLSGGLGVGFVREARPAPGAAQARA